MPLRVTQNMMSTQLIRNLNRNLVQSDKIQNQLSTGMKINKPSDDPVGITYALRYRNELSNNEQYQKNADMAASYLDMYDSVLTQTEEVFIRLKELAVKASTGTNPQSALDAINEEVQQLRNQLIDIGNTKLNGKFIFNGQLTDQQPYTSSNATTAQTDTFSIIFEVGPGTKLPINITGSSIFGNPADSSETDNIFKVLDQMTIDLAAGNFNGIIAAKSAIDTRDEKIIAQHSEIGARTNRLELSMSRLNDLEINLNALQSQTEDVDYDKLIIQSKINENVYQASLSVGAKIISATLVDFLR